MSTSLILFISAAGVIQAVMLAALLYFHPKSDRSVTVFLSLHIVTLSIFMLIPVIQYFFPWPNILLTSPFQFLIAPGLYLYIRSFKETISLRRNWIHFLPFAIFLIIDIADYSVWIQKDSVSNRPPREALFSVVTFSRNIFRNLQLLLYFFLSQKALSNYQRSIQHLYSETSKINLNWIKWLLYGYLCIVITLIIRFFFVIKYPQYYNIMTLINMALITPYIYIVSIKGLGQPALWQIHTDKNKDKIEKEIAEAEKIELHLTDIELVKDKKTGLSEERISEIVQKVIFLMETEKIYQEPDITLLQLAAKLQLSAHHLSQAINSGLKRNFYDLINNYRVEEAKRLLLDTKSINYTILSVGFEAGFNSKTTFNTVFKKFTGLTPTEYRDKQKERTAA